MGARKAINASPLINTFVWAIVDHYFCYDLVQVNSGKLTGRDGYTEVFVRFMNSGFIWFSVSAGFQFINLEALFGILCFKIWKWVFNLNSGFIGFSVSAGFQFITLEAVFGILCFKMWIWVFNLKSGFVGFSVSVGFQFINLEAVFGILC